MARDPRVVAVVVAYNRSELLDEVLRGLQSQTRAVDALVVVDNASTDTSAELARTRAPEADLVQLTTNTGGAGGFAVGMAAAVARHDPDWIWVMDDDTVPTSGALEGLLDAIARYPRTDLYAVGSRVTWTDGTDHPMNTPRPRLFAGATTRRWAAAVGAVPVRSISFVSSMYRADRVRALGYPIVDYFLWNDDFEYSTRIIGEGAGLSVPQSLVVHKTKALASTDSDPGPRFRFEVRNKIWMFCFSRSLTFTEKLVYGASSLVRWCRAFLRSADRATLRRGFTEGVREARGARPRPNDRALAGADVPEDVLDEIRRAA